MTVRCFVDTNVLIYTRDSLDLRKKTLATSWITELWQARSVVVSPQTLNEYYNVTTSRLKPSLEREVARRDVRRFWQWTVVLPDKELYELAFATQDRFKLSWWDSLIVAAARRGGCTHLLSEDLHNGQDLAGVRVVDPFKAEPASLLGA